MLVLGRQWASARILGRSLPIGRSVHKPFLAILGFRQDWVVIRGCLVDKHWPVVAVYALLGRLITHLRDVWYLRISPILWIARYASTVSDAGILRLLTTPAQTRQTGCHGRRAR